MSDPGPDDDPFSGLPMFGDMMKAFAAQGPLHWDAARQVAGLTATGGEPEVNVDPSVRFALGELARIADLQVQQVTGLDTTVGGRPPEVSPVTPGVWAQRTLEAYRPLFTELATSLGSAPPDDVGADPAAAMMAGLNRMLGPAMMGMAVGSMVGQLARRAFGQYDLPIPRSASSELLIVPATIDAFAADWSLDVDQVRLWVLIQELAGHAVLLVPHVREALSDLVRRHVGAFRPDPSAVMEKLAGDDVLSSGDPMAALQRAFGDPEVLLGAVRTPEQDHLAPVLDAVMAVVVGYVDRTVDHVAATVLGGGSQIAEAVRRRRIESSPDDIFVERLLGLRLTRDQVDRGRAFIDGIVERAGAEGLRPLFATPAGLPTPAEVDAPGLWLARIELG